MKVRERIERLWYRQGTPHVALRSAAWLYGKLIVLRRSMYHRGMLNSVRLPVPVVVVGNITTGGTGKTPLTLWLADALANRGRKPGIACRAYAATARTAGPVTPLDDPAIKGDEAVLMAMHANCPVWSGPNRAATAAAMVAAHPAIDLVLCDDGLQHYGLARDVELAVIDAARGFGNGRLLPAGPLREPITRLANVDAIVIHGNDKVDALPRDVPRFSMRLTGAVAARVSDPAHTRPVDAFKGHRVCAVAGIGHPDRFFRHIAALGIDAIAHPFPDHHRYTEEDLRRIQADFVLMTEKDAIKCRNFRDDRLWMLPVSAQVDAALVDSIMECIGDESPLGRPAGSTPKHD
jgi:tetraacyldisaccharide 4'-kinase